MNRISVIMPNLDMGRFLGEAVASILRQGVSVEEILLVDCGSTDDSLDQARALERAGAPLRLLHCEQRAPGAARNVALAQARGDVIAFLDADDLWPEDKLALQTERLQRAPPVQMVSGMVTYFEDWDPVALGPRAGSRTETLFHCHLGAAIYRREVFDAVGGFEPDLLYGEDVDLLLRLRDAELPLAFLRATTLFYRRHDQSMMQTASERRARDLNRALFKSLTRRRARGLPPAREFRFEDYCEPG